MAERNAMMDSTHALSISRQAQRAGISRGSVYYVPKSVGAVDLACMRHLGTVHLERPFMGHGRAHVAGPAEPGRGVRSDGSM